MRTESTSIFIITLLSGVHILATSFRADANNFFRTKIEDDAGSIQSPNYGFEYGKKADYIWRFGMREGKVLKLKLTHLKIFYYDGDNNKLCSTSYRVYVNRVNEDCTKYIIEGSGDSPEYHHIYSTQSCSEVECRFGCSRLKVDTGFVEVGYYGSGNKPIPRLPASTMSGFRMTYEYLDCPPDETNSITQTSIPTTTPTTTMTTLTRATTTKAPKTIYSTTATMTSTTTKRATKSNSVTNVASYPIAVGFRPPFETTPHSQSSVTVISANEVKGEEGSGNAFIYGSIGGGIAFVLLLVIIIFCIVRQKKKKEKTEETAPENRNAAMTDNVLYGTSRDFDDDRGDPSVNPAVVYATVDESAKSHINDVGRHGKEKMYEEVGDFNNTKQSNQLDEIVDATPPTNQKLMYSSVAIDASGEKSTIRYEKGG